MSVWSKLRGTIETIFSIGLGGPNLKNNVGIVEVRNAADSGFAIVRGAMPAGNNDLVTKAYADQLATRYIITAQFNGSSSLPVNSGTEHFIAVTSSGPNATIGQLLWDDGSSTGTVQVVSAASGNLILTTQAFTGGTVTFLADSLYMWDTSATSWVNAGGSAITGAVREIRLPITNASSQSSSTTIPANAVICDVALDISTPYSAGATITVGQSGSASLLMATTDSLATVAGMYKVNQDTSWGSSALALLVTIAGTPAAGAGFAIVHYSVPNA